MATSGAYYNTSFTFNHSFVDSADPTLFFTGTLANTDITVYKRTGSTTVSPGTLTTAVPAGSGGVYTITLTATEMSCDEVVLSFAASGMVKEAVSITTEPTPSDISEVQKSAVSISDFRATGFSTFDPASDTVANVTTVGSVSGSVGSVVAAVTAGTVSDKTGYSISGSLTTLDALDTAQDSQHSTTQSAISGLNNISASDVYTEFTSGSNEDVFKANVSGLATASALTTVDTEVGQIKAKTDQLTFTVANQVDANALTGGGGGDATSSNQNTIISHLTDMKGAGWTSTDTLAEITEDVTGLNGDAMRGTDGASTTTPPTAAQIYAEFTSGSNEDAFKADVQNLATSAEIAALNDFDPAADTVANVSQVGSVSSAVATDTASRNASKADVSNLSTSAEIAALNDFDPASQSVSIQGTLSNLDQLDSAQDAQHATTQAAIAALNDPTVQEIANQILSNDVSTVEATMPEHSLGTIILCVLESVRQGQTWTIKKSNGVDTAFTKTLVLDSSAEPVVEVQ